ncbi:hypothetical protein BU25DRAFT_39418 [Macroventuria anomochaeta]|uniref:Uncharacterized protein n=1 Tax=Macroventuria anomochaeta TaxID=301207 RepID=A0ACB6S1G5_9PLEO|nr:uncharacterized protein BU25DRAFT_39418 [Macroventuria anomochaeta]KAF2628080.1 hypothetical protein BU25DRAFT_39418 [Macroventuria anomochaeta]
MYLPPRLQRQTANTGKLQPTEGIFQAQNARHLIRSQGSVESHYLPIHVSCHHHRPPDPSSDSLSFEIPVDWTQIHATKFAARSTHTSKDPVPPKPKSSATSPPCTTWRPRKIQSAQLSAFRSKKGAYVYFWKMRIAVKKPKSKKREEMEDIHCIRGGMGTKHRHQMFLVWAEKNPYVDAYGRVFVD